LDLKVHDHANMIKGLIKMTKGQSWNESKLSNRVNGQAITRVHVSCLELDWYRVTKGLLCECI
jgi:hypothetical protein